MFAAARRKLLVGALALGVLCGGASAQVTPTDDDVVIGRADAAVTLLEYGSAMCSHCRAFEASSWDTLKSEFIDTGRVRFIFREALAPVSPDGSGVIESITLAIYQIARCDHASPEQYFTRLSAGFEQQRAIFQSASMAIVRDHLVGIGAEAGLMREQVMACISDPAGGARIERLGAAFTRDGAAAGVPPHEMGTPMFFLDGVRIETNNVMTPEGLRRVLDAAIAAKS